MKRLVFLVIVATSLLLTACGGGDSGITVNEPWARSSPMMERAGAAYMVLENAGSEDDKLVSVTTDVAMMVELHETKEVNGMMEMAPVSGGIVVPANGQAELKPGGYHIMLMQLNEELVAGDTINLTLQFEKAGEVQITAEVRDE